MSNEETQVLDLDFSFNDLDITSEDEFKAAEEASDTRLKPGHHQLRIVNANINGPSDKDPTWINIQLDLENQNGKGIKHWVMVPTEKVGYGEKGSIYPFKSFQSFMKGLGETVEYTDNGVSLRTVLPKYFKDVEKLEGLTFEADVGYKGFYLAYADDGKVKVYNKKGVALTNGDNEEYSWDDFDDAKLACVNLKIKLSPFINVLKITPTDKPALVTKEKKVAF